MSDFRHLRVRAPRCDSAQRSRRDLQMRRRIFHICGWSKMRMSAGRNVWATGNSDRALHRDRVRSWRASRSGSQRLWSHAREIHLHPCLTHGWHRYALYRGYCRRHAWTVTRRASRTAGGGQCAAHGERAVLERKSRAVRRAAAWQRRRSSWTVTRSATGTPFRTEQYP